MRRWLLVIASVGCHKEVASPPPPSAAMTLAARGDASIGDGAVADGGPALVELLHAVPATVRVSSQVANKSITPEHLVDGDLQTAWNSVTGELVGAWIEVTVPDDAAIAELRMTVGHTGKSARGEDYFTMNPRIRRVSVLRGNTVLARFTLDPARRDLQPLVLHTSGGTLRIAVDEIVPGTKRTWRETCVSELEAWGTPPPVWTKPARPLVPTIAVGEPTTGSDDDAYDWCKQRLGPARDDYEVYLHAAVETGGDCEEYAAGSAAAAACHFNIRNEPSCYSSSPIALDRDPWTEVAATCFTSDDSRYDGTTCAIEVATDGHWWEGLSIEPPKTTNRVDDKKWDVDVFQTRVVDVIAGGSPELLVRYRISDTENSDMLAICRAKPTRACTGPFVTSGKTWKARPAVRGSTLVLERESGSPPPGVLGQVPLDF